MIPKSQVRGEQAFLRAALGRTRPASQRPRDATACEKIHHVHMGFSIDGGTKWRVYKGKSHENG